MTEIKIPFNEWSKDKLEKGIKTATSRNKMYGMPGDTFVVNLSDGEHTYRLKCVTKRPLLVVAKNNYREEGCKSPEEFAEVWIEIHPHKGWTPYHQVWYHTFEEVVE